MGRNSPSLSSKVKSSSKTQKLHNPSTQFAKPTEILGDAGLSGEEKKTALNTWEQDARQLMTASNEGMPGKQEGGHADDWHQLDEVERAKSKIRVEPKRKLSH